MKREMYLLKTVILCLLFLLVGKSALAQTELITNGNFEIFPDSPWIVSTNGANQTDSWFSISLSSGAHSGSRYRYIGAKIDGTSAANNVDSLIYQQVTVPAGTTSATLSYYLRITTSESSASAFDHLDVEIRNTSGAVLATPASYSNQSASQFSSWTQKTVNLTVYAGQTIRIAFHGTTDGDTMTVFRIDDVSLLASGTTQQTGSLRVTIAPAGAVSAGAQWQVDGGAFHNSGATVNQLSVGSHTVAFKPISGWTPPGSRPVPVYANQITTDSGTYQAQSGGAFSLSFPLAGYTAYTAKVTSVFDHSATVYPHPTLGITTYCNNGTITAFNGDSVSDDVTNRNPNANDPNITPQPSSACPLSEKKPLYGYSGSFALGGINYAGDAGDGGASVLNYEGHPGFDYPTTPVNVLAASGGIAHRVVGSAYNTIWIDHENGYSTWYLHLSQQIADPSGSGERVERDAVIGISGDKGSSGSFHLHFEVRKKVTDAQSEFYGQYVPVDPYGWFGSGDDPYVVNGNPVSDLLWSDQPEITDPDITALANTTQPVYWSYIAINNFSKWYIVETTTSANPAVMFLYSANSSGLQWKPINNSAFNGFPSASTNFQSVTVSPDGRSIHFGALSGSIADPDITALANTTQPVYWSYIAINNFSKWYIVDTNSSPNPAVMFLSSGDPSGGIRWKPISNSTFTGFPTAGINFSSVAVSSDGRSITFGGLSH